MSKADRVMRVDRIANHLVSKFKAPNSRNFFCKCAWNMSENDIWTIYEKTQAPNVKSPLKLFIFLCQIKMGK